VPNRTIHPQLDTDFGAGARREQQDFVIDTLGVLLLLAQLDQEPFDLDLGGADLITPTPTFDLLDVVELHLDVWHHDGS